MPHTFEIVTGKLYDPSGAEVCKGYAGGNEGKNPEAINNPDMCNVPRTGPLPPGLYTMQEPVEHSKLGPYAIPLSPDPSNQMFNRGGFYMHGDTTPSGNASEGCIIMPRAIRERTYQSDDKQIRVVKSL